MLPTLDAPRRHLILELLLGALTAFAPLSIDMYLPALPAIGQDLSAPASAVGLTLVSFFLGLSVGMLVSGPLLDRFGRTRPLYVGLVVFVLSSAGCALARDVQTLIACRLLQALGASVGLVMTRAVVRDLHSGVEAARMLSRLVLVMGAAPILAPLLGGFLLEHFGWRSLFTTLAVTGAVALVAVLLLLPETAPEYRSTPLRGELMALVLDRRFTVHVLAIAMTQAGMFAYIAGSSFVFITLFHVPPAHFGWFFGANALGLISASQANRPLVSRFGLVPVLHTALRLSALFGTMVLVVAWTGFGGLWGMAGALLLYLTSLGCIAPNATALAMEHHGGRAGLASAVMGALGFGLAACASSLVSAAYDGTAVPMAATVAGCAVAAMMVARGGGAPPG